MTTLAAGQHITQKYGKFGTSGMRQTANPGFLFAMLVGFHGTGKTQFLASHPGALIINVDLNPPPIYSPDSPPTVAQVWPTVGEDGLPRDANGKPMLVTVQAIEDLTKEIIAAAKEGRPHPQTVVLDTATSMIPLLYAHFDEKLKATSSSGEAHGKAVWGKTYDWFVPWAMSLRAVGVGVYLNAHLTNEVIPLGDDQHKEEPRLSMAAKLYARIAPLLNLVVGFQIRKRTASEDVPYTYKVAGVERTGTKKVNREIEEYIMVTEHSLFGRLLRNRVGLPREIVIPKENAWDAFVQIYLTSAGQTKKGTE